MKTFSAQRFRELCDEVDAAMERLSKCSPALLNARLAPLKKIIPNWGDEKLRWHLCIAESVGKEEEEVGLFYSFCFNYTMDTMDTVSSV